MYPSSHLAALASASLAAIDRPIAEATGLPNQAYTDYDFFVFERDKIWANTWVCVGFASEIAEKGDARPVSLMGLPLMMLRDQNNEVQVFHNVCSHRGHPLVSKPCKLRGAIRCPYHSWTYGFNGELRGTPHIGGVNQHQAEGFDHNRHGLRAVRSELWMDLVFVNLSGDAPPLLQHLTQLTGRWQQFCGPEGFAQFRPATSNGTLQLDIRANWKLMIENNNESYHLPWVHPGLNSYSKIEDHYPIFAEDYAGQGSYVYDLAGNAGITLPGLADWPQDKLKHAEYASFYPNVLFGIHVDQFWAIIIEPLAPNHTRERMQLYFVGDAAEDESLATTRQTVLESWRAIFTEDVGVAEGMQQGRHSPAFGGGVFSPVMDTPTHHFHRWAARKLAQS